jgi:hypothetical protein
MSGQASGELGDLSAGTQQPGAGPALANPPPPDVV